MADYFRGLREKGGGRTSGVKSGNKLNMKIVTETKKVFRGRKWKKEPPYHHENH